MIIEILKTRKKKDHILVFIKAVVFQHVGLSWLMNSRNNTEFDFECECPIWVKEGRW